MASWPRSLAAPAAALLLLAAASAEGTFYKELSKYERWDEYSLMQVLSRLSVAGGGGAGAPRTRQEQLAADATASRRAAAAAAAAAAGEEEKPAPMMVAASAVLGSSVLLKTAETAEDLEPAASPELARKSKVVLILIEILPFVPMFGVDRLYMGNIGTGILKLCVTFCTLGVGGVVWSLVDGIAIFLNCLDLSDTINVLGFKANFPPHDLKTARTLAFVYVAVLFVWVCCCGPLAVCLFHHLKGMGKDAERLAFPKGSPPREGRPPAK